MFFLSVTRDSVARLNAAAVREFRLGEWVVTVATDQWLSAVERGVGGVVVNEMPRFARDAANASLLFAEARFVEGEQAIEITRTLMGGRQLYYHAGSGGAFYCSTHIAHLRAAGVRLEEDDGALAELFVYRYVTPPGTLFKRVHQLLPGQQLRFEFDGRDWRQIIARDYCPPRRSANSSTRTKYAQVAGDALRDAVRAVAGAGEELYVLASGGLDSSILFRLAQRDLGIAEGHSTGFPFEDEERNVEKRYALTAAEAFGARHRYFVHDTETFLRGTLEAISIAEQPLFLLQSVSLFLLFRDALPADDGTVMLGQGADGLFGLRTHRAIARINRFKLAHPALAAAFHPPLWSGLCHPLLCLPPVTAAARVAFKRFGIEKAVLDTLTGGGVWGQQVHPTNPRHVLWRLGVVGDEKWARQRFNATPQQTVGSRSAALDPYTGRDVLDALSLLDFFSDIGVSQAIWSKLGESARKVLYFPFNAPGVVDTAFSIPWEVKLAEPKAVLRDVARALGIPEFIVSRPKANFSVSDRRWAIRGGVFEPLVPLAEPVWGRAELRSMQSGTSKTAWTFWTMVNHAIWKRLFVHGESLDALVDQLDQRTTDMRKRHPAGAVA